MLAQDDPTPGELERRLDRLDRNLEQGFKQINDRLDKVVSSEVFAMYQQGTDRRLSDQESFRGEAEKRLDHLDANAVTRKGVYLAIGAVCAILSIGVGLVGIWARAFFGA